MKKRNSKIKGKTTHMKHPVEITMRISEIMGQMGKIPDVDPFSFYPEFKLTQQDKDQYSDCTFDDKSYYFLWLELSVNEGNGQYGIFDEYNRKEEVERLLKVDTSKFDFLLYYIPEHKWYDLLDPRDFDTNDADHDGDYIDIQYNSPTIEHILNCLELAISIKKTITREEWQERSEICKARSFLYNDEENENNV